MIEPTAPSMLVLVSVSLVVGASLVVGLSRTWQIALLALLVQYVALGGLILGVGSSAISGLRILVGSLICLVLFLTAGRTAYGEHGIRLPAVDRHWISEILFRLAAVGLAVIGVLGTPIPEWFPSLPAELVLTSAWLMVVGLIIALVSREALWGGIGLLTAESGFETLYTALDVRPASVGLSAASGLLLALMVAVAVTIADPRARAPES